MQTRGGVLSGAKLSSHLIVASVAPRQLAENPGSLPVLDLPCEKCGV